MVPSRRRAAVTNFNELCRSGNPLARAPRTFYKFRMEFRVEKVLDRRQFLQASAGALVLAPLFSRPLFAADAPLTAGLPQGAYEIAGLEALAGKKPLIKLTARPPNYETPASYFSSAITPNDAFFVRYHLANIPRVDANTWRLQVGGPGAATPLNLSLADLQRNFEAVSITAVCQCSGNRRGLSEPHVPGVQWGVGAMGNAVWRGARLKDVLGKAEF